MFLRMFFLVFVLSISTIFAHDNKKKKIIKAHEHGVGILKICLFFFDILFLSQKILYCLSFFTTDLKQSNCATKTIITNKSCLAILFLLVILITLSES